MLKNNQFQWKLRCISLALCVLFSQSASGLDRHITKQDKEAANSDKTTETVETISDTTTPEKKRHTPRAVNISKQTIQNHYKAPASQAIICKRRAYTGSRIKKRFCMTVAEYNRKILDERHTNGGVNPTRLR